MKIIFEFNMRKTGKVGHGLILLIRILLDLKMWMIYTVPE